MFLKEVVVYAGLKVLVEVGSNREPLIVSHGQGIVGEQLRPIPIHLLNIIIITLINYSNIKLYFKTENLSL